ncbi:hypothetical protein Tco_0920052 [Tanacetum coccineum]
MYEWLASDSLMSVSAGLLSVICYRLRPVPSTASSFLDVSIDLFPDFAGREFLEKLEHFSHLAVDLLALLENGVLKSSHPFGVRCHIMGWVVQSDAVLRSCDAVLDIVVTASRVICDAVSSF